MSNDLHMQEINKKAAAVRDSRQITKKDNEKGPKKIKNTKEGSSEPNKQTTYIEDVPVDLMIDLRFPNKRIILPKGKKSIFGLLFLLSLGAFAFKKVPELSKRVDQVVNFSNTLDISNDDNVAIITFVDFDPKNGNGEKYGDAAMLSTSDGHNILFDTLRSNCWDDLRDYLIKNNKKEFEVYISHNHGDHYENLFDLVDDEEFKVTKVYLPDIESFDGRAIVLKNKGIEVVRLKEGMTFNIGENCEAEVLFGPEKIDESPDERSYINNQSLVTKIKIKTKNGYVTYLMGGDMQEEAAQRILARGIDVKADIMKADHHGGGDSVEYIRKVSPSFYVIDFCNWETDYSFVEDNVAEADKWGNVLSTYLNGEITLVIKGSGEIETVLARNSEPFKCEVTDSFGNKYVETYYLNKDSSHVLTEQMKKAIIAKNYSKAFSTKRKFSFCF